MTGESELRRLREATVRLRNDISKASSIVAAKRKKAADATAAAGRSKSTSTIKLKLAEADRATRDANTAEKKRAELEKNSAAAEKKVATGQNNVDRDRANAQQKALRDLQRRSDAAALQFDVDEFRIEPQPRLRSGAGGDGYDVFLSHASEDKDEIARPLQEALEARGVSVWFDEIQIRVGQSIRQRIEDGIANARFGVVIISLSFFAKQWTNAELDGLFGRKMDSGEDVLLPVWHHVSKDEVTRHSPLLAGISALNSSLMTIEEMADALAQVIQESAAE